MENYLLFIAASIMLCIVPGPDMIFLLSRTVAQGRAAGISAALGINAGAYVHLLAALLGISAILTASAELYTLLRWVGAAYLVYIGLRALFGRENAFIPEEKAPVRTKYSVIFWQSFLSDVLNPKVAVFFLAFLPQFAEGEGSERIMHTLFLGCTLNMIAIIINIALVCSAAMLSSKLRRNSRIADRLGRIMGGIFVALGLRLAWEKV